MAAEEATPRASLDLEQQGTPPPSGSYKVTRTARGQDTFNTIDLIGERPFSI